MAPAKDLTIGDMGQLIDQVSSYNNAPNALGYSVFYYATQMYRNENIRVLAVDGMVPSAQTITDGTYPLCTNYYAVLRKDTGPEDPARELVAWLLSVEGQRLAAETGYVPMTGGIFDEEEVDAEEWARTRLSSGTGGTEPRKQTTFVHYPHTLAALPGDVQAMAGAWLEQAAADVGVELNADNIHYSLTVSGELLNLSVIKWGAEDKSSRARCTVIDMERMRELKLSDVFFDGFNYIDYINTHIALMPGDTVVYHYAKEDFEPAEYHRKVNYTGLPKDYPNFAVSLSERGSYLDIVLDSDNPYLRGVGRFPAYIGVQLGHWVSPWGGCTVETTYQEHLLPGGAAFLAPSLCIDDGRVPEAEARINAALADAAERHMRANDVQALHKGYRVESRVTFAGHYAIVSFVVKTDGDPPKTAKVLSYTLADLHTGECFDVLELFDRWRSTSEVAYYDDYAYWVAEGEGEAIQGYQPPENPVLESVRIWEEALVVTIVRGGTSQVDAVFPLSLLEQDR